MQNYLFCNNKDGMRCIRLGMIILSLLASLLSQSLHAEAEPILIGLDGEYGLKNSTSAQSIELGLQLAIKEINTAGGLLGGRPLQLKTRDNRSVPARGIYNIKAFAALPNLVAVIGGRFSPVQIAAIPTVHEEKVILIDAWGSADGITDHEFNPSYTFRVSLKDSYAMPTLLNHALSQSWRQVALLLPNTAWGRSNVNAAQTFLAQQSLPKIVKTLWYNWGDRSLARQYQEILAAGAEAVILVANDIEGSLLVRHIASLPEEQRLPVISHWGVTGGQFVEACKGQLAHIDFAVVQTFSLFNAQPEALARVRKALAEDYGITRLEDIQSPVGLGHAYDIVHLLALAIEKAGSIERAAVRDALEALDSYRGLVRYYQQPFSASDHDALDLADVFMAYYDEQGIIRPLSPQP